jgi:hypothetical protein
MDTATPATISDLLRYPVKGLSADRMQRANLSPDSPIPGDRRFAIAHGSAPLDTGSPVWLKKAFFLQLMSNAKLANLTAVWDEDTQMLELQRGGRTITRGQLTDQTGRTVIEQFFSAFLKSDTRGGAPRLVDLGDRSFSDEEPEWISIIGTASVGDIERVVGRPVDPLRFRANVMVAGTQPWEEFTWVGKTVSLGGALLRVEERIGRCAATNVDPATGQRDMTIPRDLMRGFGHEFCGVYARVVQGGEIAVGDTVSLRDTAVTG